MVLNVPVMVTVMDEIVLFSAFIMVWLDVPKATFWYCQALDPAGIREHWIPGDSGRLASSWYEFTDREKSWSERFTLARPKKPVAIPFGRAWETIGTIRQYHNSATGVHLKP